jgi:hypothetical protein
MPKCICCGQETPMTLNQQGAALEDIEGMFNSSNMVRTHERASAHVLRAHGINVISVPLIIQWTHFAKREVVNVCAAMALSSVKTKERGRILRATETGRLCAETFIQIAKTVLSLKTRPGRLKGLTAKEVATAYKAATDEVHGAEQTDDVG